MMKPFPKRMGKAYALDCACHYSLFCTTKNTENTKANKRESSFLRRRESRTLSDTLGIPAFAGMTWVMTVAAAFPPAIAAPKGMFKTGCKQKTFAPVLDVH